MWPFDSAILSSPFVDDRFLFRGYGLTRIDVEEFRSVYRELPPAERPPLSPYLDAHWYAELNPDLTEADWDPFSHFVNQGFKQRRSPHPLIKLDYIERHHGQLADGPAGLEALVEVLRTGSTEPSPYFEQTYYLEANPEAAAFPSGPLGHFLEAPDDRCSIPCQFFDPDFYRSRYADVPDHPNAAPSCIFAPTATDSVDFRVLSSTRTSTFTATLIWPNPVFRRSITFLSLAGTRGERHVTSADTWEDMAQCPGRALSRRC